MSLTVYQDWE